MDHLGESVDRLIDVENVVGSQYSDIIRGNESDNMIDAGAGDDTIQVSLVMIHLRVAMVTIP